MPTTFARPELLASVDWLAESLSRSGLRLLDCRWRVDGSGRRHFSDGHIPGAVHLDWAEQLVDAEDPLPFQLAGPEAFASAMIGAGVADGTTVVLYDDTQSLYAARVWWTLRAYGFESARLLDGGWPAWLASGRPISTAAPRERSSTVFTPRLDPRRRLSTADVASLVRSGRALLVDARTPAEYHGQGGPGERRGHIAGAVSLPAALLSEEGGHRFPPADVLAQVITAAGIARGRRIVVYDAAGIGAAKVAFALELLGFEDVAVYDPGWTDWAPRPQEDYPVES
ncbi:MAG TPA: sulfurtransferase [Candidatus Caenarcaniphilales bacterium]|nr:sulfurtransferase [Candidatus Caenarcaniphilales bacterium]